LDSSRNTNSDEPKPVYLAEREQTKWLEEQLSKPPTTPWRVAVFHHPMFTAGPRHEAALPRLQHWFDLFRKYRVDVVFSGHEHNFQVSTRDAKTGNIQFFVSGAGGELRGGALNRTMTEQGIVGWAPQRHFLIVDVNDKEMRVSPVGPQPIRVRNAAGATIPPEVVVPRRER
ncbi:MAG TPA: metallophosphoesterase, partial [Bryobacteraceae bacterium]|nr:metallophosphoesterase [Bryobacteraceae bacterium]